MLLSLFYCLSYYHTQVVHECSAYTATCCAVTFSSVDLFAVQKAGNKKSQVSSDATEAMDSDSQVVEYYLM